MNGPEEREHRMTFVLNYCSTAVLCRTTSLNALPTKHRIVSAEVVRMVAQRRKGVGGGCRATRGGRHPCVRAVVCTCRCECITNSRRDNAESAPIFRYCSQFCSVSRSARLRRNTSGTSFLLTHRKQDGSPLRVLGSAIVCEIPSE